MRITCFYVLALIAAMFATGCGNTNSSSVGRAPAPEDSSTNLSEPTDLTPPEDSSTDLSEPTDLTPPEDSSTDLSGLTDITLRNQASGWVITSMTVESTDFSWSLGSPLYPGESIQIVTRQPFAMHHGAGEC